MFKGAVVYVSEADNAFGYPAVFETDLSQRLLYQCPSYF